MSADLFEAFGQANLAGSLANKGCEKQTTTDSFVDLSTSTDNIQRHNHRSSNVTKIEPIFQPGGHGGNDVLFDASEEAPGENDDFGDFEAVKDYAMLPTRTQRPRTTAPTTTGIKPAYPQWPAATNKAALIDLHGLNDTPAQHASQPQIHMNTAPPNPSLHARTDQTPQASQTLPAAQPVISEPQDDNEPWGDFETIEASQPALPTPPRYKTHPPAPLQATSGMSSRSILRALQPKTPPVPRSDDTEGWDPFEDGNLISTSSQPPTAAHQPLASTAPSLSPSSTFGSASPIPHDAQRPTNIPPPTILLSLLPTTFQYLITLVLSKSPPQDLAAQITTTFRVSARLISTPARTLRWRRDTLLSQSTRIGVAGKPGGMKLSSLNRGENMKEEREAGEAMEAWNSSIHQFSQVLKSASSGSGRPMNLRLSMSMPVKPLTGPGVMQAALVCPLCGLKRSERVVGADDVGVEDVFGEFWLENWGHEECAEWWYQWHGQLSQR